MPPAQTRLTPWIKVSRTTLVTRLRAYGRRIRILPPPDVPTEGASVLWTAIHGSSGLDGSGFCWDCGSARSVWPPPPLLAERRGHVPIRWPRPSPLFEGPNQVCREAPLAAAGQDPWPHARPAVRSVRRRGGPPGHSPCAPRDRRRGGRGPHWPGSPPSRGWCRRPQGQTWRTFRWFFVGGSAHKRDPQFGAHRIAAGQTYRSSSGRRDSNPRPPPWQGDT
jgi:hypothetical protein